MRVDSGANGADMSEKWSDEKFGSEAGDADTTVQEKAVSYPADSKLSNRFRERLVRLCFKHRLKLRQSYARIVPKASFKVNRYAHVWQSKRMRREVRKLHTYLGRVVRDIERRIANDLALSQAFACELELVRRLLR